ncbi:MAG: carbohydrate ABC transporter permease [Anaerolineae bacterium]
MAAVAPVLGRRRSSPLRRRRDIYFYLFIAPWLIGFVLFRAGPLLAAVWLSFVKWEIVTPPVWVGFANWAAMPRDPLFWQSLKVTTLYTMAVVPLSVVLGFMLAFLMNQDVKGVTVFRTIYYLPSVTSGVAISMLWIWIFNPDFGLLNYFLSMVGITGPAWLFDPQWVVPAFIFMSLWGLGSTTIIYLAGLQGIPTQLYEAAEMDGANGWRKLLHVTVPMMTPIVFFNLVMNVIGTFQVFTSAFVMTQGGPRNASLFYVLYLFRNAFQYFEMGYAASLAWVLFAIIGFFTVIIFSTSNRWVYYEGSAKGIL